MSDFSLIATVRSVIDETDLTSPQEIADKVLGMVSRSDTRRALAEALPYLVQTELSRQRMARPAAGPAGEPRGEARRTHNPSSKVRALRGYADAWKVRLRDRISVGHGDWKMLADCTAADLRLAAERRRTHAAGALANAAEYESFAAALDEHKVDRFGTLPEAVQCTLLSGEEEAA